MFARASSVYSKGFNTRFEEMQSTGLGYKPVERSSEYELAEVGDEQTGSSPLPTQKLSNDPAKPSAQAPQRLSRVQLLPLSIQILLTIFPVLFVGILPHRRLYISLLADHESCCSTRCDCSLSGQEADLSNWTGRATGHFPITHHISRNFRCNDWKVLQSLRLIWGRTWNQVRGIVLGPTLGHSDLSNLC